MIPINDYEQSPDLPGDFSPIEAFCRFEELILGQINGLEQEFDRKVAQWVMSLAYRSCLAVEQTGKELAAVGNDPWTDEDELEAEEYCSECSNPPRHKTDEGWKCDAHYSKMIERRRAEDQGAEGDYQEEE